MPGPQIEDELADWRLLAEQALGLRPPSQNVRPTG
jgi:hypothetical protein